MRVLMVASNREKTPLPVPPLGAAVVAAAMKDAGHEVTFLDLMFERRPHAALRAQLSVIEPQVVSISIRNLDTTSFLYSRFFLDEARELVRIAREFQAKVIVGGACVGVLPEEIIRYVEADVGIHGAGEQAIVELLGHWERASDWRDVPGIVFPDGDRMICNPKAVSTTIETTQSRPWHFINVAQYANRTGPLQIQTRRGCALKCNYCVYPSIEGSHYQMRPIPDVVDEIRDMIETHPGLPIEFVDSTFNLPLKYAIDLCHAIADEKLLAPFQTSGFYPGAVTEELVDAMNRAGFVQAIVTPDSASDTILRSMKKGFSRQRLEEFAHLRARANFNVMWSFLFGASQETEETVTETFDFIHRFVPESDLVFLQMGIRVYPNTPIHEELVEAGVVDCEDPLLHEYYYVAPTIDADRLRQIITDEISKRPTLTTANDVTSPLYQFALRIMGTLRVRSPIGKGANGMKRLTQLRLRRPLGPSRIIETSLHNDS